MTHFQLYLLSISFKNYAANRNFIAKSYFRSFDEQSLTVLDYVDDAKLSLEHCRDVGVLHQSLANDFSQFYAQVTRSWITSPVPLQIKSHG